MSPTEPMKVLMLAGFPGSGKTTLLLQLVRVLSQDGRRRVAVIENEAGKIGVDDQFLQNQGLQMRQILGGCVCCTLQGDLITTVKALRQSYDPQVLVVEPSGVAGPSMIKQVFADPLMGATRPCMVMLVDVKRFLALKAVLGPFLTEGLAAADLVAINKIDQVEVNTLVQVSADLRQMCPRAEIVPISAKEAVNLELVLEQIQQTWDSQPGYMGNTPEAKPLSLPPTLVDEFQHALTPEQQRRQHEHHHDHGHHHGPEVVALAKQIPLEYKPPMPADWVAGQVSNLLMRITADLAGAGCPLIGHVKAIVQDGNGASMLLRTTAPNQEPDRLGDLPAQLRQITLTVNVIAYGVNRHTVWEIFRGAMHEYRYAPPPPVN